MLNLNSIMLGTENVAKLAKFYQQVFQTEPGWKSDDGQFIGWQVKNCWFMIGFHDKVKGASPNPERLILGLETSDVKGEFERLKAIEGAKVIAEPYQPGGDASDMWLATLTDPDGNYFQLASPMKDM